jgi:hypothetical protein
VEEKEGEEEVEDEEIDGGLQAGRGLEGHRVVSGRAQDALQEQLGSQCSAVQCGAVRCSAVQCSAVQGATSTFTTSRPASSSSLPGYSSSSPPPPTRPGAPALFLST